MRPHALHPGLIQGKEGIKFCHLATLRAVGGLGGDVAPLRQRDGEGAAAAVAPPGGGAQRAASQASRRSVKVIYKRAMALHSPFFGDNQFPSKSMIAFLQACKILENEVHIMKFLLWPSEIWQP